MATRNLLRIVATVALWSIGPLAAAAEVWHTSTVTSLYPLADGSWVITFAVDSPSCTSGSAPKYYHVAVGSNGVTAEGSKKMYAAVLAAQVTGRSVTINFDNSTTACYINRLSINN